MQQLIFDTVTLRNFLSAGNVTQAINLNLDDVTLILGRNTDANDGESRNGAGKTTILQAISFAIYGQPLSKIKVDNLINNINLKNMMVTIDFRRDGVRFRIERGRKPNVLRFFKFDGETPIDLSQGENAETQKMIDAVIGMKHSMFRHIVALNTYTPPFLQLKAAEQREIMEELVGATQVSERAKALSKLMSTTRDALRHEEGSVGATVVANRRIDDAIENARKQQTAWDVARKTAVETLEGQILALEAIDFDAALAALDAHDAYMVSKSAIEARHSEAIRNRDLHMRELSMLVSRQTTLARPPATNADFYAQFTRTIEFRRADIVAKEKVIDQARAELAAVEANIASPDAQSCVCCNQPLAGTDHLVEVIASLERQADGHRSVIATAEQAIAKCETDIEGVELQIADAQRVEAENLAATQAELAAIEIEIAEKRTVATAADAVIAEVEAEAAALGDAPVILFRSRDELWMTKRAHDDIMRDLEAEKAKENPFEGQIATMEATRSEVSYDKLEELKSEYLHQEFLQKLLTNKDSFIRKKIIEQNLGYLNTRLNGHLKKLGLPHLVVFNNDMSVDISLLGRDLDFEQLSRGEMNRVVMSTCWAFRDVWENLNHSINLLFVDEMLDQGTDAQGAEAALSILKGMARDRNKNVFLISHRDELGARINRTLMASKDNGFTQFDYSGH